MERRKWKDQSPFRWQAQQLPSGGRTSTIRSFVFRTSTDDELALSGLDVLAHPGGHEPQRCLDPLRPADAASISLSVHADTGNEEHSVGNNMHDTLGAGAFEVHTESAKSSGAYRTGEQGAPGATPGDLGGQALYTSTNGVNAMDDSSWLRLMSPERLVSPEPNKMTEVEHASTQTETWGVSKTNVWQVPASPCQEAARRDKGWRSAAVTAPIISAASRRSPLPSPSQYKTAAMDNSARSPEGSMSQDIHPPSNPWHRWSGTQPLVANDGSVGGSGNDPSIARTRRKESAGGSHSKQSTPAGLLMTPNMQVRPTTFMANRDSNMSGASVFARSVTPGGVMVSAHADPNVALLVRRLEAAVADVGYYKSMASAHLSAGSPEGPAGVGSKVGEEAHGSQLAIRTMAFRVQSCSSAALTVSVDLCWCKAELASVTRALQDMIGVASGGKLDAHRTQENSRAQLAEQRDAADARQCVRPITPRTPKGTAAAVQTLSAVFQGGGCALAPRSVCVSPRQDSAAHLGEREADAGGEAVVSDGSNGEKGSRREVEEARKAHADTQASLAAQTVEFHAFKERAEVEALRLKKKLADAQERENKAKRQLQTQKKEMQKKLDGVAAELQTARATASDKTELADKQDKLITSLKKQAKQLEKGIAGGKSEQAHALTAELAEANRSLDLALLNVKSQQERAEAAELQAMREKETKRYFRRCLREVDAALGCISEECELSLQQLILSIARSMHPLVKERDLRAAALRGTALVREENSASQVSVSSSSKSEEDQESRLEREAKVVEMEGFRARLAKIEAELRGVTVQKDMLDSIRVASGATPERSGVFLSAQALSSGGGPYHVQGDDVQQLQERLNQAESDLRDLAEQKTMMRELVQSSGSQANGPHGQLSTSATDQQVMTNEPPEASGDSLQSSIEAKFSFPQAQSPQAEVRARSAQLVRQLDALHAGLVAVYAAFSEDAHKRDDDKIVESLRAELVDVNRRLDLAMDNLEQSQVQLRLGGAALREAQKERNAAVLASESAKADAAKMQTELNRLQAILEHVRKAGVVVEEEPMNKTDSSIAAVYVRLPAGSTPRDIEHRLWRGSEPSPADNSDTSGRVPEARESSTKIAIRASRKRRSSSPVPPDHALLSLEWNVVRDQADLQEDEAPSAYDRGVHEPTARAASSESRRGGVQEEGIVNYQEQNEGGDVANGAGEQAASLVLEDSNAESVKTQVSLIESLATTGQSAPKFEIETHAPPPPPAQSSRPVMLAATGKDAAEDQLAAKLAKRRAASDVEYDWETGAHESGGAPLTSATASSHASDPALPPVSDMSLKLLDRDVAGTAAVSDEDPRGPGTASLVAMFLGLGSQHDASKNAHSLTPSQPEMPEKELHGFETKDVSSLPTQKMDKMQMIPGGQDGETPEAEDWNEEEIEEETITPHVHNDGNMQLTSLSMPAVSPSSNTSDECPTFSEQDLPEMEERWDEVKKARALYPYSPQEEDELQLAVGEEMFVLGLSQPDWLVCVRAGKRPADIGLVPQNYVTMF